VVAVAGCGGSGVPRLDRSDAAPLIALAHRVAREGTCGQARDIPRFQRRVIALVNAGRVPAELQEPLTGAAAALAELRPVCVPGTEAAATDPPLLVRSPKVEPVPHASTPSQEARNIEAWLKRYSR
jgi:hypothetical protein